DWWGLYRVESSLLDASGHTDCAKLTPTPVCRLAAEMCGPVWQLGQRNYAFPDRETVILSYIRDCFWTLASPNLASARLTVLRSDLGTLEHVSCAAGCTFYIAAEPASGQAIETCPVDAKTRDDCLTLFACARSDGLGEEAVARPEHMVFPSPGGSAYGV